MIYSGIEIRLRFANGKRKETERESEIEDHRHPYRRGWKLLWTQRSAPPWVAPPSQNQKSSPVFVYVYKKRTSNRDWERERGFYRRVDRNLHLNPLCPYVWYLGWKVLRRLPNNVYLYFFNFLYIFLIVKINYY